MPLLISLSCKRCAIGSETGISDRLRRRNAFLVGADPKTVWHGFSTGANTG